MVGIIAAAYDCIADGSGEAVTVDSWVHVDGDSVDVAADNEDSVLIRAHSDAARACYILDGAERLEGTGIGGGIIGFGRRGYEGTVVIIQ